MVFKVGDFIIIFQVGLMHALTQPAAVIAFGMAGWIPTEPTEPTEFSGVIGSTCSGYSGFSVLLRSHLRSFDLAD
jgi:hypothetical protein